MPSNSAVTCRAPIRWRYTPGTCSVGAVACAAAIVANGRQDKASDRALRRGKDGWGMAG
ncbi:hypothetical protein GCM10027214_31660 [Stenotrophomonas tumulicola]